DARKLFQSLSSKLGYRKRHLYVAAICRYIDGLFDDEEQRRIAVNRQERVAEGWQGKREADRAIGTVMNLLEGTAVIYEPHEEKMLTLFLRDLCGPLPFRAVTVAPNWLSWNEGIVPKMVRDIEHDGAFERLPILADALEDAGCTDADILSHCRGP